jgi:hypothetical protein
MVESPPCTKLWARRSARRSSRGQRQRPGEYGLTLSEWCRENSLRERGGHEEKSADSGNTGQVLISQLARLGDPAVHLRKSTYNWSAQVEQ